MALGVFSAFYYGYKITSENNFINFDEGLGELTALVPVGTYTLSGIASAIRDAMNAVGDEVYTVAVDRTTRRVTISGTATFDLLTNTGSQSGLSPFSLLGFDTTSDLTGATSYTSPLSSGKSYEPQFWLQDYTDPEVFYDRVDPAVNETASGEVEVISFGLVKFAEFSIKFITNLPQDGKVIKNNPTGVSDAVDFFLNITERGLFEFIPDISQPGNFYSVILDELGGNRNGVGFKLRELTGQNLPGYFEVNSIKLRVVS